MTVSLYYQILQLQVSNSYLLYIYTKVLHHKHFKDAHFQKQVLQKKLASRQLIEQELVKCQNEEILRKMRNPVQFICASTLPHAANLVYVKKRLTGSPTVERCHDREMENITKYYDILYSQKLSQTVTDLLLKQKDRVESFLIP